MTPKRTAQSGFFSPRFLTGFAFCAIGVLLALLVFARPNQLVETQNQSVGQQSIPTFVGIRSPEPSGVPAVGTIENMEGDGLIDLAALNIHPTSVPVFLHGSSKAPIPGGAAMSTGKAFLGMTHEVVNQNTTAAFGTLSSGWSPMESVQFYINGVLAATFAANADGVFAVGISTGAGFGYVTIDQKGLTSGKETGGVVQVAPTGPYLPGVTGAPHAINTAASGHFYLYGWGYPPSTSTTVILYRNGIFQGFVATNASGRFFATFTAANNWDTSAVYSADTGTTGSMAGVSLEERADAGTPPVGDQNAARVFLDRATLDSAVGGTVSLVGEGFQAGETVTISSCAAGMALLTPFSPTPRARESRSVFSRVGQVDGWHEVLSSCIRTSQTCAALSPRPASCLPGELSPFWRTNYYQVTVGPFLLILQRRPRRAPVLTRSPRARVRS